MVCNKKLKDNSFPAPLTEGFTTSWFCKFSSCMSDNEWFWGYSSCMSDYGSGPRDSMWISGHGVVSSFKTVMWKSVNEETATFSNFNYHDCALWSIEKFHEILSPILKMVSVLGNVQIQNSNSIMPHYHIMGHFPDDIFKQIFLDDSVYISIKITLKFVPKGAINNTAALVQTMAWCWPVNKPLSEPMMLSLLMHICITQPQWVNVIPVALPLVKMVIYSQMLKLILFHVWCNSYITSGTLFYVSPTQ